MEAMTALVEFLQKAMAVFGIGMLIVGAFTFATAQAENNPAEKLKGVNLMIGGALTGLIGFFLVPMLNTAFG